MKKVIKGQAYVFGNNLDTDQIYPGQYLELVEAGDIGLHAMEGADPHFARAFKPGDIIVGGTNFGCGSSREHAAIALQAVGTGVILAESFARIFYRNAINIGLPLLVSFKISSQVSSGDKLIVDMAKGVVQNQDTGAELRAEPMSEYVFDILESGGIKPLVRKQLASLNE
ncbi:MAG: 3-isopropylmalate dehydratase [Desulfobacteraceae bacterium]|jgi:3-isopropylmalate/(R)-2-methylmalate dehydratase small subunit|nr:3-isopropylmalate dehydratase [Desulfobacteraceae bacterium]